MYSGCLEFIYWNSLCLPWWGSNVRWYPVPCAACKMHSHFQLQHLMCQNSNSCKTWLQGNKYKWKWSSQLSNHLPRYEVVTNKAQQDSNTWPLRYRCDTLPTELWSLIGSRSRASSINTLYMNHMIFVTYMSKPMFWHVCDLCLHGTQEAIYIWGVNSKQGYIGKHQLKVEIGGRWWNWCSSKKGKNTWSKHG